MLVKEIALILLKKLQTLLKASVTLRLPVDGLNKEFYQKFWNELKEPFMKFLNRAKISKRLIT